MRKTISKAKTKATTTTTATSTESAKATSQRREHTKTPTACAQKTITAACFYGQPNLNDVMEYTNDEG